MNTLKFLSKSLRFYSYRLNREHTANFISIKKIIPDYQNLETQCNCYLENLKLNDPIAPITNITTKVSDISPKSMIPVYKRHVLLIDETSSSKQAHMNWQSKLEDNDESVYPYGILKRIKEKNLQLMKQQNEECLPILMNVIELVNIAEDPVSAQDSTKTGKKYKLLCLPEWKVLSFDENSIEQVSDLVNKSNLSEHFEHLDNNKIKLSTFHEDNLLLICGHNQRDTRCGVMAKELITKMKSNDPVGFISHIGGHKFAGNIILYKQQKHETNSYWFRHINPLVADEVVEQAKKGIMVSEFYRGSASFKK